MPSSCCGGSAGAAVLAAKRYLNIIPDEPAQAAPEAGSELVKMEFTGSEQGTIPYKGDTGETYFGADTPLHRFAMVRPADVQKLISTGKWRRVAQPAAQAAARVQAEEPVPPTKTVEELRKEAESALLEARKAAADEFALPEGVTQQGVPGPLPDPEPVQVAPQPEDEKPRRRTRKGT